VRRWKLLGALVVGMVALVAAGVFVMWPQRVIWDKYVRIEKGMPGSKSRPFSALRVTFLEKTSFTK
jgi:hypothetical protein